MTSGDPAPPVPILTPRLRLESMSRADLQALAAGHGARVLDRLPYRVPDPGALPDRGFALRRLALVEQDPAQLPWVYRAVVLTATNTLVGSINFHHRAPDPFLLPYCSHGAELGYTIAPPHRRQGYATEAIGGMMRWAHDTAAVRSFFLSISPTNAPSLRLAQKLGFRQVGEQEDEVDGPEWVLRRDLTANASSE